MRKRWRVIALILLSGSLVSLSGWAAGDWVRWYEHEHEVHVGTVLEVEGEYWLVGTNVASVDPPDAGIVIFRIQPDGSLLYTSSYDWDGVQSAADVLVADAEHVLFVGQTDTYSAGGSDMYVLIADSYGQALSEWVLGESLEESASRIVLGSQGDYFIVGNQTNPLDVIADAGAPGYGGLEGRTGPYVARLDRDGQAVWENSYLSEANVVLFDASPTVNGGCYLLSTVYGYPDNDDAIRLDRLDADGTMMWSRTFDEGNSKGYSLLQLDTGRLLVAGARSSAGGSLQALLMMLEATGREVWSRTYGGSERISGLHALVETDDGRFVAAGVQLEDYGQYRDDVYLLCVDADGEMQWEQAHSTGKHVMVEGLLAGTDGGLLIAGTGGALGEPFQAMLMRVEPPEQGESP